MLSLFGDVKQQSCAVHLERNLSKLVDKLNRKEFQSQVSEIFKQKSLRGGRAVLSKVLDGWQEWEPKACLYLRANVDKSLVFYSLAKNSLWRTHLKSTNMLERFFRELKRFEKARQFRYADNSSCERFYYAFASIYNEDHHRMPKPAKVKSKGQKAAYNLTKLFHYGPSVFFLKAGGTQIPSQKGKSRDVVSSEREREQRVGKASLKETQKRNASSLVTQKS